MIYKFFLFYLPLLFSLCVHEFAHAWTARKLGDLTAFHEGRLTLNPAAHADFLGTILFPLVFLLTNSPIFFGWAKPVPVDEGALRKPREDMFWIAFAGPLSNFLLSLAGAGVLLILYIAKLKGLDMGGAALAMAEMFIYVNLLLGGFNLLPLHPLDGGKVMARFLPIRWNIFLERNQQYGYILLIIIVFGGGFRFLAIPLFTASQALIEFSQSASLWLAGAI